MQVYANRKEILTKDGLASIMGKMPVTVDTAYDATWAQKSFDSTDNGGLKDMLSPNRVSIFPIEITAIKELEVNFTSLIAGTQWGYYFTSVKEYNVPKTLIFESTWANDETKKIEVPSGAKYFGFCLALPQNDTPDHASKYASVQLLVQTTMSDFLQRKNGTIVKFN